MPLPPSEDPTFVGSSLGRTVTWEENARKTREVSETGRLDKPMNLSACLPKKPYCSSPNYLRESERNNRLDEIRASVGGRHDGAMEAASAVASAATTDGRSNRTDRTGSSAVCEQLLAEGIRYVFGNPGTVEQGFLDALTSYPALQYVYALQETVAVGIADGYARATHGPAVVQLHSGVGLGNGIGMMYQAKRVTRRWSCSPVTPGSNTRRWTRRWPLTWWAWPAR